MLKTAVQNLLEAFSLNKSTERLKNRIEDVFTPLRNKNETLKIKNLEGFRNSFEYIWDFTGTKFVDNIIQPNSNLGNIPLSIKFIPSLNDFSNWSIPLEKNPSYLISKITNDNLRSFILNSSFPNIIYESIIESSGYIEPSKHLVSENYPQVQNYDSNLYDSSDDIRYEELFRKSSSWSILTASLQRFTF